jgi:3-mercaptopyruvate sulfurtransferase SseA
MTRQLIILLVAALVALVACGPAAPTAIPATATPAPNIPYPEVPRISVADARDRWESGDAVIVDVRSPGEYEQARVPGALNIPVAEMGTRYNELPRGVEIITYCT